MAEIIDLFKTALYSTYLNLDNNKMIRYCKKIQKEDKGRYISNEGGWQSNNLQGEHPILNELFEDIEHHATLFAKDTLKVKHPLYLDNIWININGYKDTNSYHIHPNCLLSGVYYLKTPPKCGDLSFCHPSYDLTGFHWDQTILRDQLNPYNILRYYNTPKASNLLIFPYWLRHMVHPNLNTKQERISISFNLIPKL